MSKNEFIASGYCDNAIKLRVPRDEIMAHLESMLGDEITLLQKGDHYEIHMVYDDSRPNMIISKLPKGYT